MGVHQAGHSCDLQGDALTSATDGLTQAGLARALGISRAQARLLLAKGVFKADEHGKISLSEAKKAYSEYQSSLKKGKSERSRKAAGKLLEAIGTEIPDDSDFKEVYRRWMASVESDPIGVLNAAKAYLTALQVQEQKLKVDEQEKRLIPVERVNHDAEEIGTLIRSKLITIPSRVSTICEGRTARDIEEIIDIEINKALEELQKLFVRD